MTRDNPAAPILTSDLIDQMHSQEEIWNKTWCRDITERKLLLEQIDEMRGEILKDPIKKPITIGQLNWALGRTPASTGLGSDQLEPTLLRQASPAAKADLVKLCWASSTPRLFCLGR